MTTKTDAAMECVVELANYMARDTTKGAAEQYSEMRDIILEHFPPAQESETRSGCVPVGKLEHLLRNSETFGWRTANWVAAIRGLIAEAKS